jgi:hypothetical protein
MDTKAIDEKGYEYSLLVNNVMAMLANDDLNARADYIEAVHSQQKKKLMIERQQESLLPFLRKNPRMTMKPMRMKPRKDQLKMMMNNPTRRKNCRRQD